MTINQLIEKLNEMKVSGDMTVRIHAFGGIGARPCVSDASIGFDWDKGSILLQATPQLTIYTDILYVYWDEYREEFILSKDVGLDIRVKDGLVKCGTL